MEYGRRNIVDGSAYDKYFGKPINEDYIKGDNSTETNVAKILPNVVKKYCYQTRKIANHLYSKDLRTFCENIWTFLFKHIQYEYDEAGREQFRTPYRSWQERETGIDCDCFSIFVSCILTNKKVPHYFRITKYGGNNWQHIYVIVPKGNGIKFDPNNGNTYYTIDCVLHEFNREKEYNEQKLQPMNAMNGLGIITEVLAGFEEKEDAAQVLTGFILDEEHLSGDDTANLKLQLLATRNWVNENPRLYEKQNGKKADDFIKMCDYALQYWDNPETREKALNVLIENEKMQEARINGLGTPQLRKQVFTKRIAMVKAMPMKVAKPAVAEFDEDDDFEGVGAAKKSKAEKKAQKAEKKATKQEAKKEAKQERKERREANKEELKNQQGFWNKLKTAVKQGAKAVAVTANPAVIAIRGAFLFVVKLNLFGIAKKLHPAYCDDATAKKMGYTAKQIDVAKKSAAATEKIFADKMGGTKAHLKEAVLIGYLKKAQGSLKGLAEAAYGLGAIVTAAATAASIMSAVGVCVSVLKAIMKVEKDEGVEGLGSMEDEINRTEQLLRTTSVNDIVREMSGFSGLSGDEKAETASAIAKFIKAVIEKIKGAVNKKKASKNADGSTTTKKDNKSASADSKSTDGKKKGKFGEKVKDLFNKTKEAISNGKKPAEGEPGSKSNPAIARPITDNAFPSLETKSLNINTKNMETQQKKGLPKWAKWTLGIAGVAIVGGGIYYGIRQHKKKSEAALNGWATRRRNARAKAIKTVNL
jgi:hypothetical protein